MRDRLDKLVSTFNPRLQRMIRKETDQLTTALVDEFLSSGDRYSRLSSPGMSTETAAWTF